MARLPIRACLVAGLAVGLICPLLAADRHEWLLEFELGYASPASELGPWTEGQLGKLRFGTEAKLGASRILFDYQNRLRPTLWANITLDYVDDASSGIDITEAFIEWRPVPNSELVQHWRFGALYPKFSLENGERGWSSPFTTSFSAINSWLGEEIRPLGAEWNLARRVGGRGSPQALGAFAGVFYGNDPAGTLLFWRGFALHDRQTRLSDRLERPPTPIFGADGVSDYRSATLKPFAETDHRPGYYAGLDWRYATRALMRIGVYDNNADPASFSDGQWGWRTKFQHAAAQFSLPAGVGLVLQWLDGETYWFIRTTTEGTLTPLSSLVKDEFEARFALLTKLFRNRHRLSLRYDRFDMSRNPDLNIDSGHAWTLAYRFDTAQRIAWSLEWLSIASSRDLWTTFYGLPSSARERQLRMQMNLRLGTRR